MNYEEISVQEYVEYYVNGDILRIPVCRTPETTRVWIDPHDQYIYGCEPYIKKTENDNYLYRIGVQNNEL